jgi:hypothetical protein
MAETKQLVKTYDDETLIESRVQAYREGAYNHQERRHSEWRETYSLYRDRVFVNRLTQRQSVNVPLMKESIRTMLSKTDEFTDLYFESLSGDKQKEIFVNEYWKWFYNEDNLELKDIVDKKQVALYGRSIMKLNLMQGRPTIDILEPYDWLCDRYADPADIEHTANYQAHVNIFKSISDIEADETFDKEGVAKLRLKYAESLGLALSEENVKSLQAKNERMQDMGLWDINNPSVGQTYVELNEHYIRLWDEESERLVIHLRITADGITLFNKKLEDMFGINFFPFITWADDIEKTDIWSDGMGDIIRTPNKILNSWFSQMVENRVLRNFGMHFYDATASDKWIPQTYDPVPFGWYPTAGDPNKVTKQVNIPDLSESMDEMNFLIGMVERATASTATEKGVDEGKDVTLGQVKLMLANSNQRITSIAKFYRLARIELGEKWYKFVMANEKWIEPVKLFKKSYKGNYYSEEVNVADWKDEIGYACKVMSTAERDQKTIESIQKLQAISGMFPENVPLKQILKKKALDMVELSPEEIDEVMSFDEQNGLNGEENAGLDKSKISTPENPAIPVQ